ncbi:uncharacterized protein LOC115821758 [Chanos chanos]|uniref:Uncharacterized protein LOC115821758 n=1 Tax=Chanos chanos TaxID=29144 RepID=A0A6J2WAX6_CHACN|nr:uncharacterized protein LOC115821758 [Chanos chanos]
MAVEELHGRLLEQFLSYSGFLGTGVSGQETTVYSRDGDDVTLPCHNVVYPDCSSTTWIFSYMGSPAVLLVSHGEKSTENRERADRLSLGSKCSLHISKVTPQDAGQYTCRPYQNAVCTFQIPSDEMNLIWVNETDVSLTDSRFQISSSNHCPSALTVRLQDQDNNRKWTCQLTDGEVKTSVSYITKRTGEGVKLNKNKVQTNLNTPRPTDKKCM